MVVRSIISRPASIVVLVLAGAALVALIGINITPQRSTAPDRAPQARDELRPDRYIVVLRDDVSRAQSVADEHARDHGAQVEHVYDNAFKGYAAYIPPSRLDQVEADSRVQFVEQDRAVEAFAQTTPTGVDRIQADSSSTQAGNGSGSVNVGVAVIDSGIASHTDLNVNGGYNCTGGRTTNYTDGNGHGSHVAGTIGAKDDSAGVVGAAPGTSLYAVKVLNNQGWGWQSWVNCGIDWVAGNAASKSIKVANMSLGGSGSEDEKCDPATGTYTGTDSQHKAICTAVYKGLTFVVAAGNDNQDLAGFTPAAYDEVLTVTAIADGDGQPGGLKNPTCRTGETDDTPASFSNWTTSNTTSSDANHTIAAPGVCINSTWLKGGYKTISGTSMASPHVAGSAALCIGSGICTSGMTPSQLIAKLRTDAAAQPTSYGYTYSGSNHYDRLVYDGSY